MLFKSALLLSVAGAVTQDYWNPKPDVDRPDYEILNKECPGYAAVEGKSYDHGSSTKLQVAGTTCDIYGYDMTELTVEVTYESEDRLHVLIKDPYDRAYQVPKSVIPRPKFKPVSSQSSKLKFSYVESPFSFSVSRSDTGEVLFDSSAAPLVFESQYLRLRTKLPDDPNLYGLGEHADPFRLNTTNYVRTLWNRDSPAVPGGENLYGSHPFYMEHRESGSHGVFLLNSNGMDIFIDKDEDGQYLEYNTLGGVFDFYFVAGPTPVDVVRQYGDIVGKPALQPYWSLGFHQCRYGYQDAYEVAEVVYNYSQANIPLETMWTDIDYMDRRRVFTVDPDRYPKDTMRDLIHQLHDNDQHYIMMVDPAVAWVDHPKKEYPPLHRGLKKHAFLRHDNGSAWLGVVWPGPVVFPDWFSKSVVGYWKGEFKRFFNPKHGLDIDGLWIDMNEPASFCQFPCVDPFETSRNLGIPPPAPPARDPPRPLPGWPCSFQPEWAAPSDCIGEDHGKRAIDDTIEDDDNEVEEYPEEDVLHQLNPDQVSDAAAHNDNIARMPSVLSHGEVESGGVVVRSEPEDGYLLDEHHKGFPGRNLLYPKYSIHNKAGYRDSWNGERGGLSNLTAATNLTHQNGLTLYDTHNLYGAMMGMVSRKAMISRRPNKRPLIITRSSFAGSGAHVGHWLGDNLSTWWHYRASIRTMLAFASLYQFNMVGSDVCGFQGDTNEELCARWASLGAFQTFYRNHADYGMGSQEFYLWDTVAESARRAIDIRYRLLDYIYTSMWLATNTGTPTMYPVFYLYPNDKNTFALDLQYFYGKSIMVAPVTEQGATSVDVYLPNDLFYDWYTHEPIQGKGDYHTFTNQSLTDIPLLIRAGAIIPLRIKSAMTTTALRREGFELLIALDDNCSAEGRLYLDDGETLEMGHYVGTTWATFHFQDGVLRIEGIFSHRPNVHIEKVTVLGAKCMTETSGEDGFIPGSKSKAGLTKQERDLRTDDKDDEQSKAGTTTPGKHSLAFNVNIKLDQATSTNLVLHGIAAEKAKAGTEEEEAEAGQKPLQGDGAPEQKIMG